MCIQESSVSVTYPMLNMTYNSNTIMALLPNPGYKARAQKDLQEAQYIAALLDAPGGLHHTHHHRRLQSCVSTRARLGYATFDAQLWKAYFVTTLYAIRTSVHAYARAMPRPAGTNAHHDLSIHLPWDIACVHSVTCTISKAMRHTIGVIHQAGADIQCQLPA